MTEKNKRIGRPVKPAEGEGQVSLGLRVPAHLKRKLELSAENNNRTLSQEVERRLARSYNPRMLAEDAAVLLEMATGATKHEIIRMVVLLLQRSYERSETDVAMLLLEILALVRRTRGSRAIVGIKREDLDILRQALKEIEEGATIHE